MQLASPIAKKKARIEIIPLIDIIFFLLATFVMVSLSMVKQQGLPVQLPSAATAVKEDPQETDVTITITVAADGTLFWNKDALTLTTMHPRLSTLAVQKPDARLVINGDADARLGDAIDILDAARTAGLKRVTFQTKPVAAPANP